MKGVHFLVAFALLAMASKLASASDPSPLQDFCVAIDDAKNGGMFFSSSVFFKTNSSVLKFGLGCQFD